jgi:hypothetical protein
VSRTPCSFSASRPSTGPSRVRPPDWLRTQWPWTMRFGADRCKSLRRFLVPRADPRGTLGSKRIHPLRMPPHRSGCGMLVAMRVQSAPMHRIATSIGLLS